MGTFRRITSLLLSLVMMVGMFLPTYAVATELEELPTEITVQESAEVTEADEVAEKATDTAEATEAADMTEATEVADTTEATEATDTTEVTEETEEPADEQTSEPETKEEESVSSTEETVPAETTAEMEATASSANNMASRAGSSGTCGENVTWTLNKGVLTISGNGAMDSFSAEGMAPWSEYADQIRRVDIKKGVTSVGAYAFCYESITSVTIPEGLREIGYYAFGTSGITDITLPGSVTSIDMVAFSGCSNLSSFKILDSADSKAETMFAGMNDWGYGVFSNCPNLETVKLGNTVKVIPDRLFSQCEGLRSVTFSDSLRVIGVSAFGGCSSLEKIVLPGSVTNVGEVAFSGCSNLRSFTVSDSENSKAETMFAGRNDWGYGVFSHCPNLETVKLGNTVKVIPEYLFSQCEGLSSITFSDSLKIIGSYAFGGCTGLEEIVLPGSVTKVGEVAFSGCSNLRSFTVLDSADSKAETMFAGRNDLGYGVFSHCPNLETVKLGNTMKVIPAYLFSQCEGLRSITFSDSLKIIGGSGFSGCIGLEEIVIPGSVTRVDEVAFSGCSNLRSFTVLDSADGKAETMFAGRNDLGYGVFSHCPNLETVKLGNTMKVIPAYLFSQCEGLRSITFSDSLKIIGASAFSGCTGLEEIVIPGSVTRVDEVAFSGCSNLRSFTILDSADHKTETMFAGRNDLENGVFSNCPNLETVKLGNTVKVLPDYLFSQCEELRSITFSDRLETIGSYVFNGCTGLEKIEIPENLTNIGAGAYAHSGVVKITFRGDAPWFETPENSEGVFEGITASVYYPADKATWTSDVMQNYGGAITWIPYSGDFEVYTENGLSYILSGKSVQLSAYQAAEEQKISVDWEISEGTSFATVKDTGLVTAKTVNQVETVVVTATAKDTGAQETITLKILPQNTTLDIFLEDETLTEQLDVDMYSTESITLAAKLNGEKIAVSWVSGNSTIAEVEDGVVSLEKCGTVTITAKDVYGISGSATLNVFYLDPAKKLTASVNAPSIGLQPGQPAQMSVFGEEELAANLLTFTSSNKDMATVDEKGMITGGTKTGTVKITAAIKDDPQKRSVVVSVKIIAAQIKTLTLDPVDVILDKTKESRSIIITPTAESEFGSMPLTGKSLKWTSSNTKLATVKGNADGSATVTILAGKDGTATITAQATDLVKAAASMTLTVYDKTPKLGSGTITLNPMAVAGTDVALIPGYENEIETVSIDNADFSASYNAETGMLTVTATKAVKNSTVKTNVNVICADGKTYPLALSITVKSVVPSVTIKQNSKLDLFYKNSEATLSVTAKNAEVKSLALTGTDDFVMDETGVIRFADTLSKKYAENIKYKPVTKATLLVYLEGYAHPAEKTITIGTTATKLTLSTDPASSTVNTNAKFGAELDVRFKLYNKTAKQILDLEDKDVVSIAGYNVNVDSDEVRLELVEAKKATLTVSVQKENWMYPVTLKHTVSVTDKDPTLKLGKTTLKLNTKLPKLTDSASVVLNNGNLTITGFNDDNLFVTTAKAGTDAWMNAQKIQVKYVNAGNSGNIEVSMKTGEIPKAGTYTYTAVPYVNGKALKTVTIKVSVGSTEPKVTLSAAGKLKATDPESQIVYTVSKITNVEGNLEDVAFVQGEEWFQISPLYRDSKGKQCFSLSLREDVTYSSKQTYKVVFCYKICDEWFASNTLSIKVS